MRSLLCAGASALALIAANGCARAARSAADESQPFFAGEPLRAGSDGYQWSFGDRAGAVSDSGVYTFARAGRYEVVASKGDAVLSRRLLTIVPRPVLRAIPMDASRVLWIPSPKESVGVMVDFCEQAAPSFFTTASGARDPFLRYLLELAAQPPSDELAIDPDEGFAVFEVPDIKARITTVGIVDEPAALSGAVALFVADGFVVTRAVTDGPIVELSAPGGDRIALFVDRGYLYLAAFTEQETFAQIEALAERVAQLPAEGLTSDADLFRLRGRVSDGGAFVFARASVVGGFELDHVVASLLFDGAHLTLDATLDAAKPLWDVTASPELSAEHLDGAAGAHLYASASAEPEALSRILSSLAPLRPRDPSGAALDRAGEGRPPAREELAGELARALAGAASFVARIDVQRSIAKLSEREGLPDFVGEWTLRADIADAEQSGALLRALGEKLGGASGFSADGKRFWLSNAQPRRQSAVALQALRGTFGADAFARGHLSALIDVGALLRELELPPAGGTPELHLFASTFLKQLTGIDTVFVDVHPQPGGGRVRGTLTLRPR